MTYMVLIFIAMLASLLAIVVWFFIAYQKYKKRHIQLLMFLLLFPTALSAQYVDDDCRISFKWLTNQQGKLECDMGGLVCEFLPSSTRWEIRARNNTDEDAQIIWENAQLILNGKAMKIDFGDTVAQPTISGHSQIAQTFSAYYIIDKTREYVKMYDKRQIRKGCNAAVTIILPISIGKQTKFFHTFDFVVTHEL